MGSGRLNEGKKSHINRSNRMIGLISTPLNYHDITSTRNVGTERLRSKLEQTISEI